MNLINSERSQAMQDGSPVFSVLFFRSFEVIRSKYDLTLFQFSVLIQCYVSMKHPANYSGYFYADLICSLYGESRSSIDRVLNIFAQRGLIFLLKDKSMIRPSNVNSFTKIYSLEEPGKSILRYYFASIASRMSSYSKQGGKYDIDVVSMNFPASYLLALRHFFNGDRMTFVEWGYHNNHTELDLIVPDYQKYLEKELEFFKGIPSRPNRRDIAKIQNKQALSKKNKKKYKYNQRKYNIKNRNTLLSSKKKKKR